MMVRLKISRTAARELDEIWYSIAIDNQSATERLVVQFHAAFQVISLGPQIGREWSDLGPNLRSFVVGNYLIFYQIGEDLVSIVRVWNAGRELRSLGDMS